MRFDKIDTPPPPFFFYPLFSMVVSPLGPNFCFAVVVVVVFGFVFHGVFELLFRGCCFLLIYFFIWLVVYCLYISCCWFSSSSFSCLGDVVVFCLFDVGLLLFFLGDVVVVLFV